MGAALLFKPMGPIGEVASDNDNINDENDNSRLTPQPLIQRLPHQVHEADEQGHGDDKECAAWQG